MMKWILVIAGVVTLLAVGCQKGEQQHAQSEPATQQQAIDVTVDMLAVAVDPNCGMDMHKTAVKDTTVYQGKLYGFCSTGCKTAFLKNPEEKLAKLTTPAAE